MNTYRIVNDQTGAECQIEAVNAAMALMFMHHNAGFINGEVFLAEGGTEIRFSDDDARRMLGGFDEWSVIQIGGQLFPDDMDSAEADSLYRTWCD